MCFLVTQPAKCDQFSITSSQYLIGIKGQDTIEIRVACVFLLTFEESFEKNLFFSMMRFGFYRKILSALCLSSIKIEP